VKFEPFHSGNFIGDVSQGGSCNVFSIFFNPHGNGTHTETVGHIAKEKFPIYKYLKKSFFEARLISVHPEKFENDSIIMMSQLKEILNDSCPDALIIRTLPNPSTKINAQYSGTNPPYLEVEAANYLRELDVKHLLLDLPSIDREDDNGELLAHHSFWNYPKSPRTDSTISEMVFVPDNIIDGNYLLNLQTVSFDSDASPSKPLLFAIV